MLSLWISPFRNRPAPFIVLLFAFVCGILADRQLAISAELCWLIGLSSLMVGWGVRRHPISSTGLLLLAIFNAGAVWHHAYWHFFPRHDLANYGVGCPLAGIPILARGTVVTGPQIVPSADAKSVDRSRFQLQVSQVKHVRWTRVSGVRTVTVHGQLTGICVGDRIELVATMRPIPKPRNPGESDRMQYFRARRQLTRFDAPYPECVVVIGRDRHPKFWLGRVRQWCLQTMRRYLTRDLAPLASALLLGKRDSLQPTLRESFLHTGTVHLLAVSGLHVGIVASIFLLAARTRLLPWRISLLAVMVLMVAYALLAEGRSPVIRAALLVQIVCLSWITRRRLAPFNSLAAAALVVLIRNPCELFRAGTQLSFLAVAVLACIGPQFFDRPPEDPLDRLVWRTRPIGGRLVRRFCRATARMFLASAAVWLATLPITMQTFHLVCPWAIVLSLVLWLPLAIALYAAVGILIFHVLFPPMAIACGWVCDHSLGILVEVVRRVERWPTSHFWVAGPSETWTILFYTTMAALISHPLTRHSRSAWLLFAVFFCAFAAVESRLAENTQADRLRCTILSVGHGSCVLIEFPNHSRMLYDAGRLGDAGAGTDTVSRLLWTRGIQSIDAIVISHADADHYNLVPGILQRFAVLSLYTHPRAGASSSGLRRLQSIAASQGTACKDLSEGDDLRIGDCHVQVLHPPRHYSIDSMHDHRADNANSIVLQINYRGHTILLPGDIEKDGMERLMSHYHIDADLVMAPHHGSQHSSPRDFANWCTPEWMVISGRNHHVLDEFSSLAIRQPCRMLHTAVHGAVDVIIDQAGLHVATFLPVTAAD